MWGNTVGQIATAVIAVAATTVLGLGLRVVFGRLAGHARDTDAAWDDVAWGLGRNLAVPVCVATGLWFALQVISLPPAGRTVAGKLLPAATIAAITLGTATILADVIRAIALRRAGVAKSATIFVNIARAVVLAIGLLILLQSLGISITPMLTALGVGGLAVALALQDTLANLFAGVHILASRKVQPGDYVSLDSGEAGYIVDINWRNTAVRQLAGNMVIVPNSRFAGAIVTNYHRPQHDMSVLVQVGVAYASDLDLVERVTIDVGRQVMTTVPGGIAGHEPFIRFHTFADSSINFSVILRAGEYTDKYLIVHEFIKRLHRRYHTEGIEIPFPIRTIVTPNTPAPTDLDAAVPHPRH